MPSLSVVWPNYNHGRYLVEACRAMLAQSFQPAEIVIVDDGSTDDSWAILQELAQAHSQIRLIRNSQNSGVVFSLNRGLDLARGDYVHCTASDDCVVPGFYEKSMQLLARFPQAALCSSRSKVVNENDQYLETWPPADFTSTTPCYLSPAEVHSALDRHGPWYQANTAIWRRDALLGAGGFSPELHCLTDGFMFELLAFRHGVCYLPESLGLYRILPEAVSSVIRSNEDHLVEQRLRHYQAAEKLMFTVFSADFPESYKQAVHRRNLRFANDVANRKVVADMRTRNFVPGALVRLVEIVQMGVRFLHYVRIERPSPRNVAAKVYRKVERCWWKPQNSTSEANLPATTSVANGATQRNAA